jgi:hypothetical protein
MPAHHNVEAYLDAYINAGSIGNEAKSPLFRSAAGRTEQTDAPGGCLADDPAPRRRSFSAASCASAATASARPASLPISTTAAHSKTRNSWPHMKAHDQII